MNDDTVVPPKTPSYYNPHNVIQDVKLNSTPLINAEPPQERPEDFLKRKYPIKVIATAIVLVVMVLAIPVGIYLNQRPTRVFIEATATPSPTPTPTPTPSELPGYDN